jgi:hypothetical protein
MASEATPLNGNEEMHPVAKLAKQVSDLHAEAHKHAKNSNPLHPEHEEGDAPDSSAAVAALGAYMAVAGPFFCCFGSFSLILGYYALHYATNASASAQCPFPLAQYLTYYAYGLLAAGGIMILAICVPPLISCNGCIFAVMQLVGLALMLMTLLSYGKAAECGHNLWWASLAFSNPTIACLVYCCCSPFGQAKAAALVGYKAATAAHWAAAEAPSKAALAGAV